ncbi:hypothetical protein GCM10017673_54220 [Streptosporangium violaceochromogenes]|nr:hypothetical protein GCM10017673_54220 [Streptosporangium violaceochromogenes]
MNAPNGSNSRLSPSGEEAAVDRQSKALIVVQRLLRKQGIRTRLDHTISLGLFASRPDTTQWPDKPPVRSWLTRCPPELVVIDFTGRRQATVTMGPHAECYLISLPARPEPYNVSRTRPQRVVALIAQAVSRGAA